MRQDEFFALVAAVGLLFGQDILALVQGGAKPGPSAPVFEPTTSERNAVQGVIAALGGDKVLKEKFATYFDVMARAIDVSPESFRTVGDLNDHQFRAGELYTKEIPGGAKGFGEAVAAAYTEMLGQDNKAVTKNEAIQAVQALEWACRQ